LNSPQKKRNYLSGYPMAAGLGLLTALSVGVNGYHFGIEDQAIYLPAVLKDLDPSLFPYDHAFFDAQTKPTLIDELVAGIVRFGARVPGGRLAEVKGGGPSGPEDTQSSRPPGARDLVRWWKEGP